ncbi:metal-dependent hydrolase [Halomicroarcula limicola]|uniref:Metal-dependent hydrolase n=1 Tax=Haloarcula limicola TaxID=1429915 RepID=A0A8J7Y8R0_9EURY|nr:metal-dependent hydrolase [Halomicroarcula limicola]MBV0922821.1 metal-dependent hydrolase [Halomicroarcula limicola]
MPSLVVHYAFVGLLAATLLGAAFDRRSLLLSLVVVTIPDIDAFIALFSRAGHRTATTNLVIPAILALVLAADLYWRDESYVRTRWGAYGVRVAWFCIVVYAVGHVLFDTVTGGANLLWPIHDEFYVFRGRLELSTRRGIVQTFVEWKPNSGGGSSPSLKSIGNTSTVQMDTGVDPNPGRAEPENVDRIFPVVRGGWQLYVLVTGTLATAARFVVGYDLPEE